MKIVQIQSEMERFLGSSEPEAICITGKWGVGKTFAWNKKLDAATTAGNVGLRKYAYVSLFGQNSLDDLKQALFENTVSLKDGDIAAVPTQQTFGERVRDLAKNPRKLRALVDGIPYLRDYGSFLSRSFFLAVRNQLVCLDDLERAGSGLEVKDVLGLVSFLKEQRKCKVALLLNDEQLEGAAAADFRSQIEKVFDVKLRFDPTPQEAADVGIAKTSSFHVQLAEMTTKLGIVNIRVLRKIERLVHRLSELLVTHDSRVLESVIPSLALFGWCVYQPNEAPSLEYVKTYNRFSQLFQEKQGTKASPDEEKWRLTLMGLNYTNTDDFDLLLLESVERGYFDQEAVRTAAQAMTTRLQQADKGAAIRAAWDRYHGSFENDAEEMIREFVAAFKQDCKVIDPHSASSLLGLLRRLGNGALADELATLYMEQRGDEVPQFYDISLSHRGELTDEKLKAAFLAKTATFRDERDPSEVLKQLAHSSGWNPQDIALLSGLTADDLYRMFKRLKGDDIRLVITQALKFGKYQGVDEVTHSIGVNAEAALKRIGEESILNRMRVGAFGITVDAPGKSA